MTEVGACRVVCLREARIVRLGEACIAVALIGGALVREARLAEARVGGVGGVEVAKDGLGEFRVGVAQIGKVLIAVALVRRGVALRLIILIAAKALRLMLRRLVG